MSGKINKQDSVAGNAASASVQKDVKSQKGTTEQTKPASLAPASSADGQTLQLQEPAGNGVSELQPDAAIAGVTLSPTPDHSCLHDSGVNTVMDALCSSVHLSDGVAVLEVRAIPEAGFHRAGRFWPHGAVHIFVSDDPEAQVPEDERGNPLFGCVISTATATRLKAEKMLIVTELKPVANSGAEDN